MTRTRTTMRTTMSTMMRTTMGTTTTIKTTTTTATTTMSTRTMTMAGWSEWPRVKDQVHEVRGEQELRMHMMMVTVVA